MNFTIRHETAKDYYQSELVTRQAFWNLYKPGAEEHFIVHSMRNHPDFIAELSFVIESENTIIGSIFYSKSKVIDEKENVHEVITFGPVSISPSHHRKGLGKALITHSIREAKKLGYSAIIIGGFPYHYQSYGFEGTKKYGIAMPDKKFYTGIMALPLYPNALDSIKGVLYFSDCLSVDAKDVEAFDQKFPPLEKKVLPCQREFEKAICETE